jgi:hypothetical protein
MGYISNCFKLIHAVHPLIYTSVSFYLIAGTVTWKVEKLGKLLRPLVVA